MTEKFPALQPHATNNPPEWSTKPNNSDNKDKIPLFLRLNTAKQRKQHAYGKIVEYGARTTFAKAL